MEINYEIIIFLVYLKLMSVILGKKEFERIFQIMRAAATELKNHALFILIYILAFSRAGCYLFNESLDFSSSLRSFQMVLGFSAGMYTSTDMLDFHSYSGSIFLFCHYVCICLIFLNFVAVILESFYKDIGAHAKQNNKITKMSVKKMRTLFATIKSELKAWFSDKR